MRTLLVPILALSSCVVSTRDEAPTPERLYGLWVNVDTGSVTALAFEPSSSEADVAGLADVYHLSSYPDGGTPTEVQRGTFTIEEGDGWELVTHVVWASAGGQVGQDYGNPIRTLTDTELTVERADGTLRTYTAADALP